MTPDKAGVRKPTLLWNHVAPSTFRVDASATSGQCLITRSKRPCFTSSLLLTQLLPQSP
jgi:hypothetical protein